MFINFWKYKNFDRYWFVAKAKTRALDTSIRYQQMKRRSRFIIGNWAIGLRVQRHATVAFNSASRYASKVLRVWSTKSFVGQALKMINRIKNCAFAMMFPVQHIGGLDHGNFVRSLAENTVIHELYQHIELQLKLILISKFLCHSNRSTTSNETSNHYVCRL